VLALPEEVLRHFRGRPKRPFAGWNSQSTGAAIARLGKTLQRGEMASDLEQSTQLQIDIARGK
jgi:hypothetical protein